MIWKTALHLALCWIVLSLVSGQLTKEQKDQIVALHNHYRSVVSPKAADMLHMVWNNTLSSIAQRYAARCNFNYNMDVRDKLGENIFLTTRDFNITEAIASWFNEHKHYEYATQTCNTRCRHYTQMVWANSSRVGCASHFCETLNDEKNAMFLVCNYSPLYIEGKTPYREGDPCSKCPEETSECIENACAQIESSTKKSIMNPRTTDTSRTGPAGSAGFTKLSVTTLLLSVLMTSLIF